MDLLLERLFTQGSPLLVLVGVVYLFLRALRDILRTLHDRDKEQREFIKGLAIEHLEARELTRGCLNDNTAAMRENTKALGTVAEVVRGCPFRAEH